MDTELTSDVCSGCGARRPKRAHWFWVYPEIRQPKLEPIACYCRACAEARGLRRRTWRPEAA